MTENAMPRRRERNGTSLIEVLVVIVILLVGILAVVQIFPPGLALLRATRNNTVAAQLAKSEMARILGQQGQLAEMIVPVVYVNTASGVRVQIDTNRRPGDLMPQLDTDGFGRINVNGDVVVNGNPVGKWYHVSGPNLFTRVIGETKPVPGPRTIKDTTGDYLGSLVQLTFGPAYYYNDANTLVGEDGVLQVYGNDMVRRRGDRNFNQPSDRRRPNSWEFYLVDGGGTVSGEPFDGEDQIWLPYSNAAVKYRVSFSFIYDNGPNGEQYDVIVQANLDPNQSQPYASPYGNYWVVSLKQLVALPDLNGGANQFDPSKFIGVEGGSVRCQRVFKELRRDDLFDAADPYQYKVLGYGKNTQSGRGFAVGTIVVNPEAFDFRVRTSGGRTEPLIARVDYTVFDWRIIRDDFRVPAVGDTVKLSVNVVRNLRRLGADQVPYTGVDLAVPNLKAPNAQDKEQNDFVLVDTDSGGIVLGGLPGDARSGYTVDYLRGFVTFRDCDPNVPGVNLYVSYPTTDPNQPWTDPILSPDMSGHSLRAYYMGSGEWSVQPFKATRQYRTAWVFRANGLGPGECLVGGTFDGNGNPQGDPYRIYFPIADLGQKVVVGEMWVSAPGVQPYPIYDQELEIDGLDGPRNVAYADIRGRAGQSTVFDFSQGYAARRVRGASVKVRVLWNSSYFSLTGDPEQNYRSLEEWMRSYRRSETESMQVGGR
ncbi:MAG: hypothetical protein KIT11_11085 [Fimbriimonadaceae bacterium]|nr:hypothetical protein [Fimbriimonadaceae bacterium]QYK55865.1 MAG: hypothetical protein KF733_12755 [Fimbriimonadaceae bacterium]